MHEMSVAWCEGCVLKISQYISGGKPHLINRFCEVELGVNLLTRKTYSKCILWIS